MSFFGLEQYDRLQQEKKRFLEVKGEQEDLAVYTWGEDSYDGLGDALQEGGDELNDETFGGTDEVGEFSVAHLTVLHFLSRAGKDFDFTQQALLLDHHPGLAPSQSATFEQPSAQPGPTRDTEHAYGAQASSSCTVVTELNPVPLSNSSPLPCSSSRPIPLGRKIALLGAAPIEQHFSQSR